MERRRARAGAVKAAAEAKAAAAAVREESTCAMSDGGLLQMVEQRLKLQGRVDNSSDTSDSIWKRIHHVIESAVKKNDLSDGATLYFFCWAAPSRKLA